MTVTPEEPDSTRAIAREVLGGLVRLAPPHPARWRVGLRSAIAMGLPMSLYTLMGYPSLGLQAAAGGFLSIYASTLVARERAKVLPFMGLLLFAAAALGVATATTPWAFIIALIAVPVGAGWAMLAFRVGPPGPVFVVLLFGLSAVITGADATGARRNDPLLYVAVITSGLLISYLVSVLPLTAPGQFRQRGRTLREVVPGPELGATGRLLLWRITGAAIIGTLVSVLWLDLERGYWTVATAVTVIGLATQRRVMLSRSLHRIVGTLVGVLLYAGLAPLVSQQWVLVMTLVALQFVIELVVVRNYALALVCITPLVLLLNEAATGGAGIAEITAHRVIDTVVGSAIGLAMSVVGWRAGRKKTLAG